MSVPPLGMAFRALVQRLKSTSCKVYGSPWTGATSPSSFWMRMFRPWLAPSTSSVASTAWFTSVLCRVMPRGRAKACTRLAVRSIRSSASAISCTYSVRCGSSFTPLADPPQAVLHAVQRVGDLMGDAGHQLPDAQHLLLLPKLGVGPIHVAADRRGEVDGHPQRAGKGHENAQQVQPVGRRQHGRIGGKSQRIARESIAGTKAASPRRPSSSTWPRRSTAPRRADTCPR